MVIINDLKYYARAYYTKKLDDQGSDDVETRTVWWFSLEQEKPVSIDELISSGICRTEDDTEEINNKGYIQMVKVDIVALEKEFIDRIVTVVDQKNFKNITDHDFDYEFRVFLETHGDLGWEWFAFERYVLEIETIRWCHCNGIDFVNEKPSRQ